MNRIKKISFSVLGFVLISVCMFPISSFASLAPTIFYFSKPQVIDNTGYIAVKGEYGSDESAFLVYYQLSAISNSSLSYVAEDPVLILDYAAANKIEFHINGDPITDYHFSYVIMSSTGEMWGFYSFDFTGDFYGDYFYMPNGFSITHLDAQGNIDRTSLEDDYPNFNYLFIEDSYDYMYLVSILSVLEQSGSLSDAESELLNKIIDNTDTISETLDKIKVEFAVKLQTILDQNAEFKEFLRRLVVSTENIENIISPFYEETISWLYMIEDDLIYIMDYTDDLEANTDQIESLLQQLLDEFTYTGDTVITEPDTSVLNGYYEAEGELLDNLQLSAPLNVDINSNALAFCWDTVELFFLSHDKILAAVLVVLSFGIMAMVLGR